MLFCLLLAVAFSAYLIPAISTAQFPGKPGEERKAIEHPGKPVEKPKVEYPGKAVDKPKPEDPGKPVTADFVKNSIQGHTKAQSKDGIFVIRDEKLNREWRSILSKIHDPVRSFQKEGKTYYFTCVDFKSVDSNDVLDVDFWMVHKGGKLEVTDTKIHKVNGEPRYTYERINIKEIK